MQLMFDRKRWKFSVVLLYTRAKAASLGHTGSFADPCVIPVRKREGEFSSLVVVRVGLNFFSGQNLLGDKLGLVPLLLYRLHVANPYEKSRR